jgi:hypothetical protein
MPKKDQTEFQETERIDRKEAHDKATKDYDDAVKRHKASIADYKRHITMVEGFVEDATQLSGETMTLTDKINGTRIGDPLEKVEFDKAAHDTDKSFAMFIGRLKQTKNLIQTRLKNAEDNPPEPPAPFAD